MSPIIPGRLSFMAKYGKPEHREELTKHVDHLLDLADTGRREVKGRYGRMHNIHSELAVSSEIPLNSHQIHRIIDSPKFDGMHHPMVNLGKFHFGDLTHEHWNKMVTTGRDMDVLGLMPHMPEEHLGAVANDTKRDPFVRRQAAIHYDFRRAAE